MHNFIKRDLVNLLQKCLTVFPTTDIFELHKCGKLIFVKLINFKGNLVWSNS